MVGQYKYLAIFVATVTHLLLSHVWPCCMRNCVRASDVDGNDCVPLLVRHGLEGLVAEDTGIVDNNVDSAKSVNGLLHDLGTLEIRVEVGSAVSARLFDLLDDDFCSLAVLVLSRRTQVIYDDFCAASCQLESVADQVSDASKSELSADAQNTTSNAQRCSRSTETVAGTGDDGDSPLEGDLAILRSWEV